MQDIALVILVKPIVTLQKVRWLKFHVPFGFIQFIYRFFQPVPGSGQNVRVLSVS